MAVHMYYVQVYTSTNVYSNFMKINKKLFIGATSGYLDSS